MSDRPHARAVKQAFRAKRADQPNPNPYLPPYRRAVAPKLQAGFELQGFRLIERLGKGHSAQVWKAVVIDPDHPVQTLSLRQPVAIKFYEGDRSRTSLVRRDREYQVASGLDHPNVVKVHELMLSGARPFHDFLVMEYVTGRTLKAMIPSDGMDALRVIEIGTQLLSGLTEIHANGALHRDIKPANVIVQEKPSYGPAPHYIPKLLDLGIVHVMDNLSPALTGSSFLGSTHYSSYEQLTGTGIDERSDVYSFGALMFHCLTGKAMYDGMPAPAISVQMTTEPLFIKPGNMGSGASTKRELIRFVNHCLAKDPASRPSSAASALRDLEEIKAKAWERAQEEAMVALRYGRYDGHSLPRG